MITCVQPVSMIVAGGCSPVPSLKWTASLSNIILSFNTGIAARTNPTGVQHQMFGVAGFNNTDTWVTSIRADNQSLSNLQIAGVEYDTIGYAPINDVFVILGVQGIGRVFCEPLSLASNLAFNGNTGTDVLYAAFNQLVYLNDGNFLGVYNPQTNTLLANVAKPAFATNFRKGITIDEPNKKLYVMVTNSSGFPLFAELLQYDISTNTPTLVNSFPLLINPAFNDSPGTCVFCPDNKMVYCSFSQTSPVFSSKLTRFNPATGLFQNTTALTNAVSRMVYNPGSQLVYMCDANFMRLICASSDTQIGTIGGFTSVSQMAFSPFNNSVGVLDVGTSPNPEVFDYA